MSSCNSESKIMSIARQPLQAIDNGSQPVPFSDLSEAFQERIQEIKRFLYLRIEGVHSDSHSRKSQMLLLTIPNVIPLQRNQRMCISRT